MSPLVQRQEPNWNPQPNQEKKIGKQKVLKGKVTKGEKMIYSAFLIAIVLGLYLVLSNYASMYMVNHQIQQTETEISQQASVNQGLELQVKELSDPDRILAEAKSMGMELRVDDVRSIHVNN
ncbi:cell division protein FtsL [Bacillus shivajii]|uniref:cell division protein FtsL n=1 Tax=Bacillus shivajii TaxID=1983719 RepID=UPI001CFB0E92|nr:cell division protein FtsL [Bacillus shivajii]UCZ51832.1 cell division protein FtsL [Bacillus shivajii]